MKLMITGHRKAKLTQYSESFIRKEISNIVEELLKTCWPIGLAGMADGVDLWFCEEFYLRLMDYWCYIPFENQEEYMSEGDKKLRAKLICFAKRKLNVRNSRMVEDCERAIVVWDGNKGGTHNVLQQLIENKKPFYWINPVIEKTYYIG